MENVKSYVFHLGRGLTESSIFQTKVQTGRPTEFSIEFPTEALIEGRIESLDEFPIEPQIELLILYLMFFILVGL